jgi:arylamine N-acetyltransferase
MVNIVTISSQRYLVDTGFGSSGPHHPVPLLPGAGVEEPNVGDQCIKLSYESIEDCLDPNQKFWVYRYRHSSSSPWITGYCFSEVEFLQVDFEVMNLGTSTTPGIFTQNVICVKMLMGERQEDEEAVLVGDITLFNSEVTRRVGGKSEVVQKLESETDRVEALKKWFGIKLSQEEIEGIRGMSTELK